MIRLYEIKPDAKAPRKAKRGKEITEVMNQIYEIINGHWAFISGYSKKGNVIRIESEMGLFQDTINKEIRAKILSHKLALINWNVLKQWDHNGKECANFEFSTGENGRTIQKLHGQTFTEFCDQLFEFELCSECGGDTKDHEPNTLLGNWFARCKISDNPNYKVRSHEK